MPGTHAAWQSLGAGGLYGGGQVGQGPAMPVARSEIESLRMGTGRTPEAAYPDGYLGTIRSRRDDRLLDSTKNRVNQRSYQRGVHKGERIDQSDYFYTENFNPQIGVMRQSKAAVNQENNTIDTQRFAPLQEFAPPQHLVNDGKADTVAEQPLVVEQDRRAKLSRLMPTWSV